MCNLLKAAVACLPRLSKSNHPLLCHCLWASVIDEQLSQLQGGLHKWTSHLIPPTIKCRIPPPIARPLLFSELYLHLVPHPLRTNMFSEVAVFSTGSYTSPSIQLAILQAAICTTQQAWTSIGCSWPPFLPFASLKLVPQWFISLWMAGSAVPCPCSDLHTLGGKMGILCNKVLIASISQHLTAILKLATETDGIVSWI